VQEITEILAEHHRQEMLRYMVVAPAVAAQAKLENLQVPVIQVAEEAVTELLAQYPESYNGTVAVVPELTIKEHLQLMPVRAVAVKVKDLQVAQNHIWTELLEQAVVVPEAQTKAETVAMELL
jgi:hypothetical protein